ncbi:hypothetical protein NC653_012833 [Populus alba x Populus x berolinensis]|uniref:Uncharacterized protein n=1 Tax=Populus alba x Populus x berolinensis TaxID=444605 RepID=A0AAD6QT03_9ROSI|nr:hypothetical protein NC653_012833 [Populus alba x Populus x berolinensis]
MSSFTKSRHLRCVMGMGVEAQGPKTFDQKQFSPYIKWLDQKMEGVGPGNVIYVAFGSQSYMTDSQMEEIALGLEMAGQPFHLGGQIKNMGPTSRVEGQGQGERCWRACQWVCHCWLGLWEQSRGLNARYTAMGLKAGLMVLQERDAKDDPMTVQRNVICDSVKELMRGDQGTEG